MKEHPGVKELFSWMDNQKALIQRAMLEGVRPNPEKGLTRLEVYDNLQRDYAVYERIEKYVETTIRLADTARNKLALKAEQEEKKNGR